MGLFSKFRGKASKGAEDTKTIAYNGYEITPKPVKTSGGYRVGAIITRESDGENQTHEMIRSDVIMSLDEAMDISEKKAKMTIDQLGEQIFKPRS